MVETRANSRASVTGAVRSRVKSTKQPAAISQIVQAKMPMAASVAKETTPKARPTQPAHLGSIPSSSAASETPMIMTPIETPLMASRTQPASSKPRYAWHRHS